MSNMLMWAKEELRRAGYDLNDKEDGPNRWLAEDTLDLLELFAKQGHSGSSAPFAVALFEKLATWKPITPLTGDNDEWNEVDEGIWQNCRNYRVFKGKDDQAYYIEGKVFWEWATYPDIDDGKPFKSYFTNSDSSVNIEFPWTQPETPEYIFMPSDEFPNEELN